MTTYQGHLRSRRDTTANWTASNPVLKSGEIGIELTTDARTLMKVGDGTTAWNSLAYAVDFFTLSQLVDTATVEWDTTTVPGTVRLHAINRPTVAEVTWDGGGSVVDLTGGPGKIRPIGPVGMRVTGASLACAGTDGIVFSGNETVTVTVYSINPSDNSTITYGTIPLSNAKQTVVNASYINNNWSFHTFAANSYMLVRATGTVATAKKITLTIGLAEVTS